MTKICYDISTEDKSAFSQFTVDVENGTTISVLANYNPAYRGNGLRLSVSYNCVPRDKWAGDESVLRLGMEVEILAVDVENMTKIEGRTACWIRHTEPGFSPIYRSCDIGDLEDCGQQWFDMQPFVGAIDEDQTNDQ